MTDQALCNPLARLGTRAASHLYMMIQIDSVHLLCLGVKSLA